MVTEVRLHEGDLPRFWANAFRTALPMNRANLRCLAPSGWVSLSQGELR